ncbi:hypothetical protein N180_03905 [Pedobacter antarcticus 4BY]|uniref:Uncharacterized protein n=2 Tax=Pedobacter antarcticus TaxID=34086 RepID=A0A081PFP0_9SPHI|nr:hypothetical protein [Pedobacter antarcticus]KEQ29513.1 hypothetical protein N180_03905 [Pedobacter antarcticus 4BY]SFF10813.1 hypothetical protein SAMN03003324_02419 [Pedobacter antarcticus]
MKIPMIYSVLVTALLFSVSSCTMGDKGSERVPDSISIDTVERPKVQENSQDSSGKALIDSLQTDTGQFPDKPKATESGVKK